MSHGSTNHYYLLFRLLFTYNSNGHNVSNFQENMMGPKGLTFYLHVCKMFGHILLNIH
jgi:hypothetical protein